MTFIIGAVTSIEPGATHRWWYLPAIRIGLVELPPGLDLGLQHAGARVLTPGAELVAFDQSKKMENDGTFTYLVSIRNVSSFPALYNLEGGGAT